MKAIIVAAGPSSRLMPTTNDKPKCMLQIGDKTIMQRQLEVVRQCGMDDIVVVRGYKKEMINYPGIRYYENTDYESNNILRSLFYAENEMGDGFIFSYSDIIFEQGILEKLLQSGADISLVVDVDWISHYKGRLLHPVEEAELVEVGDGKITQIGKKICSANRAHGEFIGLARFSKTGAEILRSSYGRVSNQYHSRPFQQAASLEKAYLTDMIQELIDQGYEINNVDIRGGWIEIDTPEDLEKAQREWKESPRKTI